MSTPRRSFLGRLTALLAVGAAPAALAAATPASAPVVPGGSSRADGAFWPDERWLEMLAQREHRMIIETGIISDALALRRGLNFIDGPTRTMASPTDASAWRSASIRPASRSS